jgi:hypothetical protein
MVRRTRFCRASTYRAGPLGACRQRLPIIEGNWFGGTTGYNDIIDLAGGRRPGPIARFINNTFTGAGDDCIDLDGADAHVEGNTFYAYPRGRGPGHSVACRSTGTEYNEYSNVTAVRNLFTMTTPRPDGASSRRSITRSCATFAS